MFGGISAGVGGPAAAAAAAGGSMFGTGSTLFGSTGPMSFSGTSKNPPTASVVPSPPREEGRLSDAKFSDGHHDSHIEC